MSQRVLDVGQCGPDHAAIRRLIEGKFDARVDRAHGLDDTLRLLRSEPYDLVLINRKLDADYSDGIEILKEIKRDPLLRTVPVMLVTNYAEHQALAVAEGAEYGFGKQSLQTEETRTRLQAALTPTDAPPNPLTL